MTVMPWTSIEPLGSGGIPWEKRSAADREKPWEEEVHASVGRHFSLLVKESI